VFYLDLASKNWIKLPNLTQPRVWSSMEYVNGRFFLQHCNFNWIFVIIPWFNSILGHVVVFGGNTPTPSTYEILNMENVGDWMLTNLTLNDQAKESINSLKTIQTSLRLILQKNICLRPILSLVYFN
jgi:hypothetical protein